MNPLELTRAGDNRGLEALMQMYNLVLQKEHNGFDLVHGYDTVK